MGSRYGTPIRRRDGEWEFRCGDCAKDCDARFWPLDDEFWDVKRGMVRCRACWRDLDRRVSRARHASSADIRARKAAAARRYRAENKRGQRLKDADRWAMVKDDPIKLAKARERGRDAMRRYRARQAEARAA